MKRKTNFQKSVPWWNKELTKEKKLFNRLRKNYQRETVPEIKLQKKNIYQQQRRQYTRLVAKSRKESWREFVEDNSKENPYGIAYKIAREKLCIKTVLHSVEVEGTMTKDWTQTASALLDGLFQNPTEEDMIRLKKRKELSWVNEKRTYRWTSKEILNAITTLRDRKAPVIDLIEVQMLKADVRQGLMPVISDSI